MQNEIPSCGCTFVAVLNRNLRIVFMGTPGFAVVSLQYLLDAGYPIVGVITAPDKPGGRGMKQMISSPVKQFAEEHHLNLLQPVNLKSSKFLETLKALMADLQVVVAFRMLPEVVWNMPTHGTMNLHGSLLPAFRGAAPIHWAVIRGEKMTGATTFMLQREIDTGMILLQREIPILEDDDTGLLHDRMMYIGAGLVVSSVDKICEGPIDLKLQDEKRASFAPKIHHEDGRINWSKSWIDIYNLIRGMSPYPGAWTNLDGTECKVWKAKKYSSSVTSSPGNLRQDGKALIIQTSDGEIELEELQMAGKKKMKVREFLNGYKIRNWSLT